MCLPTPEDRLILSSVTILCSRPYESLFFDAVSTLICTDGAIVAGLQLRDDILTVMGYFVCS